EPAPAVKHGELERQGEEKEQARNGGLPGPPPPARVGDRPVGTHRRRRTSIIVPPSSPVTLHSPRLRRAGRGGARSARRARSAGRTAPPGRNAHTPSVSSRTF